MRTIFKITHGELEAIRTDLQRPHDFAFERVGFIGCRFGRLQPVGRAILAAEYLPVADEDYVNAPGYGALIGADAFRKVLQHVYHNDVGLFHVHAHSGRGRPRFSSTDEREMPTFVPDFFHARGNVPHGALVVSDDSMFGYYWLPGRRVHGVIDEFRVVGSPMRRIGEP